MRSWATKLAPLIILVTSAAASIWLALRSPGEAEIQPPEPPLVEVVRVDERAVRARVHGSGRVEAERRLALTPQVGGRVTSVAEKLEPGVRVAEGDVLVQIDSRDYRLEVAQQRSRVATAKLQLAEARARHDIAKQERERARFDQGSATPLALRRPQLEARKAELSAARAALARARRDLARTRVRAPWDALVLESDVEEGQLLTASDMVAELLGDERFWVRTAVPVSRLEWLPQAPEQERDPAPVRITQRTEQGTTLAREGRFVRTIEALDDETLRAQVLVEIRDPLSDSPPLLPGTHVEVAIPGRPLSDAAVLPAGAVREGRYVWRVDGDERLERVPVEVAFARGAPEAARPKELVVRSAALEDGDRVMVTHLQSALEGMQVRVREGEGQPLAREHGG